MIAPRGVIFDLYHTLTPRESDWSKRPATCDMLGVDRRDWDRLLIETSRWRLAGEERDPYRILRRLVDQVDASIPDEKVRDVLARRTERFRDCFRNIPAPNVALLSNADVMDMDAYRGSPLEGCFDVEVFSCEVAGECIFVGDGGSNELDGAKAVGLRTVFVSGAIKELWPERIAARRATADHHVQWAHEVEGLCSLATSA
jgi:putative hydrolase of the HAD superfamily